MKIDRGGLAIVGAAGAAIATDAAFVAQEVAAWIAEVLFSLDRPAAGRHAAGTQPERA